MGASILRSSKRQANLRPERGLDANGSYGPYLTGSALGASAPRTGESVRQISLDLNYWF